MFDEGKDTFACSCSPQWRGKKCEIGRSKLFLFHKYDRQYRRRVKGVTPLKTKSTTFYTLYVAIFLVARKEL